MAPKQSPAAKALAARANPKAPVKLTIDDFSEAEFDTITELYNAIMDDRNLRAIIKKYGIKELAAGLQLFDEAKASAKVASRADEQSDVDADGDEIINISDIAEEDVDEDMSIADTATKQDLFTEDDTDVAIIGSAARARKRRRNVVEDDGDDGIDSPSRDTAKKPKPAPKQTVAQKLAAAKKEADAKKKEAKHSAQAVGTPRTTRGSKQQAGS